MSKPESILDKLQKPKQEEFITELLINFRSKTFSDLFDHLESIGKLQWFADSKIEDLISLPQLKKAEEKEVSDLEEYKKAILAFERALNLDPFHTEAAIALSSLYNDVGKYREGAAVFFKAKKRVVYCFFL